jgi:hypothetical protein
MKQNCSYGLYWFCLSSDVRKTGNLVLCTTTCPGFEIVGSHSISLKAGQDFTEKVACGHHLSKCSCFSYLCLSKLVLLRKRSPQIGNRCHFSKPIQFMTVIQFNQPLTQIQVDLHISRISNINKITATRINPCLTSPSPRIEALLNSLNHPQSKANDRFHTQTNHTIFISLESRTLTNNRRLNQFLPDFSLTTN